jgi:hypothetical protein
MLMLADIMLMLADIMLMLADVINFLNRRFNSIPLVLDMFRTFYVHLHEDYTVHAALYVMFPAHIPQAARLLA